MSNSTKSKFKMKTRFLIIMSVLVLFPIQLVYAPPPAPDPEDDFRYSDHVITGKIISSEIIKDPREDNSAETFYDTIIYQVKVEEWHKNPLENDIITVYGTHFPNDVIPEPDWGVVEFEIGDTVYLYINETDDGLEFRKYASKLLQKYIAEEETVDSVIAESPDYSIQTVFKVTSPEDVMGDTKTGVKVILSGLMGNVS